MVSKININKILQLKISRYLISGGMAFSAEYGVFVLLFYVSHLSSVVANTLSFLTGLCVSFLLNRAWVFAGKHSKKIGSQFIAYAVLAGVNLLITNVLIYFLTSWGMEAFIAKLILVILVATWNFAIFRLVIFKSEQS